MDNKKLSAHFIVYLIEHLVYIFNMNKMASKQFHAALAYLLDKEGRGAQSRLARQQNIDRGYMNAIAKGRKSGSEEVQAKIAAHFGMTYEDMLVLGRTILAGGDVQQTAVAGLAGKTKDTRQPNGSKPENGVVEFLETKKQELPPLRISEKITKVVAILESEGQYRKVLSDLIDSFYEAISVKKDNLAMRNKMKEMEERLAELERLVGENDQVRKSA